MTRSPGSRTAASSYRYALLLALGTALFLVLGAGALGIIGDGRADRWYLVVVGVLDSGIWPEHPSMADPGIDRPAGTFACEFGDGTPGLGAPFACNDKLIGAHVFLDTALAVVGAVPGEHCVGTTCSARDADGHGTHTATTAAGSPVASTTLRGVERGPVSGIAPGAHVIGVAMGQAKRHAIHAAIRGRLINGLITDEETATALLQIELNGRSGASPARMMGA